MTDRYNDKGQPIGPPLPDWSGCPDMPRTAIRGQHCDVVPLHKGHANDLHAAFGADATGTLWTYMPVGPYASEDAYAAWVADASQQSDPLFFTIVDKASDKPVGVASYLRINPAHGTVEVGWITFSPSMQKTAMATEAMYLMMRRAFDLGYRRYEWKCDSLNAPSRKAATRLGFSYEGTFRQATVYKGRNRDTSWFAIMDHEWPTIRRAIEDWLDPSNFDEDGKQKQSLTIWKNTAQSSLAGS